MNFKKKSPEHNSIYGLTEISIEFSWCISESNICPLSDKQLFSFSLFMF